MVKEKINEKVKPAKYSQIFSPLGLGVGIKPRHKTYAAYHIIRPTTMSREFTLLPWGL